MIIISNNLNYTHMKYPKLGEKYVNSETATQICFHRQRERNSQERLIDWSKLTRGRNEKSPKIRKLL